MYLYKCPSCGKYECLRTFIETKGESGRELIENRLACAWCHAVTSIQPGLILPKSKWVNS